MSEELPTIDHRIWGKSRNLDDPYPLIWHLLDAAAMAGALWDLYLTDNQRAVLADGLHTTQTHARALLVFWAGLHDLGKAAFAFQRKAEKAFAVKDDPDFPEVGDGLIGHATASQLAAATQLVGLGYAWEKGEWESGSACRVAQILGAHHGLFSGRVERDHETLAALRNLGGDGWHRQREAMFAAVHEVVGRPQQPPERDDEKPAVRADAATLALGVIVIADWLASQEPYIKSQQHRLAREPQPPSCAEFFSRTSKVAPSVLAEAGLIRGNVGPVKFVDAFGFTPNALQQSILDSLVGVIDGPGLLIMTAATGDGKTEAGLVAARALAEVCGTDGLYFALPTMGTADQMYERVSEFVSKVASGPTPVTLLHSMSWLNPEYERRSRAGLTSDVDITTEKAVDAAAATSWLRGPRRGLLAPWGTGTIDQALLSVLVVKHNALRMLGLAGKVVIVDEAHAYDAYMQALLRRLVHWLGALRCPVVLLSATLPSTVSASLAEAYVRGTGQKDVDRARFRVDYPGWTFVPADPGREPIRPSVTAQRAIAEGRTAMLQVDLRTINTSQSTEDSSRPGGRIATLVGLLEPVREEGGCIGVVCNTVAEAQNTFTALRVLRDDGVEVELLHSRFPARIREEITKRIVGRLGRDGSDRPHRMIVVGTQVIEQSLDLDFDLVVSDLAPIALLLQRAGRCHRHLRDSRPDWLASQRLVVLDPIGPDGLYAKPKQWGSVYDEYLLMATHKLLAERGGRPVAVPGDIQELVEIIYGPSFVDDAALRDHHQAYRAETQVRSAMADWVNVPPPGRIERLPQMTNKEVEEAKLVTRLGGDSVRVVCCFVDADGRRWLDRDCRRPFPEVGKKPSPDTIREIMAETIPLRAESLDLSSGEYTTPSTWRRNAWLAPLALLPHRRSAGSEWRATSGTREFTLDIDLGLVQS